MNKILIVTTISDTLSAFLFPFAHYFRAQGWVVDAMACGILDSAECVEAYDRVWEVEWSRNPLDPKNLFSAPRTIRKVLAQGEYDLVHVHTSVASFVTRYTINGLAKHQKPKVIYTAHGFNFHPGGNFLKNSVFIALEKLAGQWTDHLVVINRDDEKAAKGYGLLPAQRVHYMPGIGVDINRYNVNNVTANDILQVRQELGLAPNNSLFVAVAEFTPNKRHRDMVSALARLARPEVHLALAGDGPQSLMDETQKLATALGVQNQVHFLGFRQDVPALIRASVATLLTSEREGLPRSVMEALCLETPVIGTEIRGIRDLLAGECGRLVKVGDIEGLASAMAWMIDHPEEARMMGKRGKEHMANYDLKHIIEAHENLYAQALGKEKANVTR